MPDPSMAGLHPSGRQFVAGVADGPVPLAS